MALSLGYFEIATTLLFILVIANFFRINRKSFHTNVPFEWPLIGMLPAVIDNMNRVHDRLVEIHTIVGPTFLFKFPFFFNMSLLSSVDPMDMHYIMSKNMQNFPKAPLFSKMFDFMGKAWFNCDGEEWKIQRRVVQVLLTNNRFNRFLGKTSARNIEKGLIPVLDNAANNGSVLDLQDVFNRLTFDTSCKIVTGYNPCSLSLKLPEIPFSKALDEAEESVLLRHAMPESVWKLLKWMNIGSEKTLTHAWAILDVEIGKLISMKREQLAKETYDPTELVNGSEQKEEGIDILTSYLYANEQMYASLKIDDNFLRDTILNYMLASRDTTISSLTWFIWLVIIYPETLNKIREELKSVLPSLESENPCIFKSEDVNKLTYLHACVCESLRLYPPVPFQLRVPEKPDKLPSGVCVTPNDKIIMSVYAMARMKSIWGEDCSEFKPERWITEKGGIKHEPTYKYPVFNDGPRNCLGKDMALNHTKMVAATIIHNYNLEMMEGHVVEKNCSIILYMKHGLKVNVFKRWT
ncbi:alkane hydroxylase MAH1-like [Impatiens glandulifera]|uniref:alkane hydroxylase MAH1-like n=1 Tax=Impatiens glandulifera TaxID=253017 RepID=UPI001FB18F37|nr:alkane hydroxylase MAH1-like [Impatiens glandulifera]